MYKCHPITYTCLSLRPYIFQRFGRMNKLVGISLWNKLSHVGLLHKVFVALLLSKQDRVLFRLEVEMGALHAICRRLPTHQRIFPSVAL